LDNVCLAQETIDWAKQSNQFLVFLKLEFAKAFVKVGWDFMSLVIEMMGMAKEFINMVKLLFKNAEAIICIICITKAFKIKRGVRQGCPLAPYLFILVDEVLNFMVEIRGYQGHCFTWQF
jgi:hypothetical protein